jgi:tetratricopeptide (TPR) repeat protein
MSMLFALTLSIAAAQPTADEEARRLFETGRLAYEEGEFERALASFTRAYELSDRPELLYNIAMSHDRLRHDAAAIEWFERYLAQVPDASNRASVERRLEILRNQPVAAAEVGAGDGGGLTPWSFVILGSAGVLGGLSALWWVLATDADSDLEASCSPTCTQEDIDDSGGPAFVTMTNVFFVSAILTALAGSVVLTLDLVIDDDPEAESVAVRFSPFPTLVARF